MALLLTVGVSSSAFAVTYNDIMMNSPHNSFQKWQSPQDMLFNYDIRSFELDLHADSNYLFDWRVYHTNVSLDTTGPDPIAWTV